MHLINVIVWLLEADLNYGVYFYITKVKQYGKGLYVSAKSKDGNDVTGIQSDAFITSSGEATGILGKAGSASANTNIGVIGTASGASGLSCGVYGIVGGSINVSTQTMAVKAVNEANLGTLHYGVYALSNNIISCTNHGLYAHAAAGSNSTSYGVKSYASAGNNSIIYGTYSEASSYTATTNYGVYGSAVNASDLGTNYGGYFVSNSSGLDYGVYAKAGVVSGGVDPGPDYAAYIDGDGLIIGSWYPSDKNLKKDIKELEKASKLLAKIRPVEYEYRLE